MLSFITVYRKTSDRSPRLYARPGFYPWFYGTANSPEQLNENFMIVQYNESHAQACTFMSSSRLI